jgi:hypothetical protein
LNGIDRIISELEQRRAGIERALEALREVGEKGTAAAAPAKPPSTKVAAAEEIPNRRSEGQKRRFAEKRAAEAAQQRAAPVLKKRGLTAAGRKRLSDLMKARWASRNPPIKKRVRGKKRVGSFAASLLATPFSNFARKVV